MRPRPSNASIVDCAPWPESTAGSTSWITTRWWRGTGANAGPEERVGQDHGDKCIEGQRGRLMVGGKQKPAKGQGCDRDGAPAEPRPSYRQRQEQKRSAFGKVAESQQEDLARPPGSAAAAGRHGE